ncbi:T5orf172 domain-containing protein [Microbacterium sp. BK668]|nr:T5orf172 domain-containing protein [Microbacterium sp. BK668]
MSSAQRGVSLLFIANALVFATIVTRYPEFKDRFDPTVLTFGFMIACGPIGSLMGSVAAGRLVNRLGAVREKERLQKERTHYLNALSTLEANGDVDGAARLRAKLDDVDHAIENVDYRAANIRAGYVYVISNIGAFGPDVVKIGLTRRLDPMDRVIEPGDASVPFRFDVHALFFADAAVAIEGMLHQHFADRRLNKVNLRREYFRATPEQVLEALREHNVEVLEYAVEPAAVEYRSSLTAAT